MGHTDVYESEHWHIRSLNFETCDNTGFNRRQMYLLATLPAAVINIKSRAITWLCRRSRSSREAPFKCTPGGRETWTMEEILIEKVRQHHVLYNMKSPDYRDHHLRQEAWENIARDMETKGMFQNHRIIRIQLIRNKNLPAPWQIILEWSPNRLPSVGSGVCVKVIPCELLERIIIKLIN